jgi:hypothetical protein
MDSLAALPVRTLGWDRIAYLAWDSCFFEVRSFKTAPNSAPHKRMTIEKVSQSKKKMIEVSAPCMSLSRTIPMAEKWAT